MEDRKFNYTFLINAFKDSVGLEKAEAIVEDALVQTNLIETKYILTKENVLKICEFLKEKETGVIRIVASCLIVRINLSQIQIKE